ncbi:MAG: DUF4838 domain-containing protein [Opitutales bacterium]
MRGTPRFLSLGLLLASVVPVHAFDPTDNPDGFAAWNLYTRGNPPPAWLYEDPLPLRRGTFAFNHNLKKLLGRSDFEGNRIPLLADATIEALAEAAKARHRPVVSIALDDSTQFLLTDRFRAAYEPLTWFRDRPDFSGPILRSADGVARRVFGTDGPDAAGEPIPGGPAYLSTLAYYWAEQVPSFRTHPRLIPVLTSDRTQWFDPAFRAEDEALIRRWSQNGPAFLASWDYWFGEGYFIPRHTPGLIADSLKHQHAHNVRALFLQAQPIWGFDAPKLWLAGQLLQDVHQNPKALMDQFYRTHYGAAAEPMRAFFDACEQIWLQQNTPPHWLAWYQRVGQATLFPPETGDRLMAYLDQAADHLSAVGLPPPLPARPLRKFQPPAARHRVRTAQQAAHQRRVDRVALTRDAFTFTQTASAFWHRWRDLYIDNQATPYAERLDAYHRQRAAVVALPQLEADGFRFPARERLLLLQPPVDRTPIPPDAKPAIPADAWQRLAFDHAPDTDTLTQFDLYALERMGPLRVSSRPYRTGRITIDRSGDSPVLVVAGQPNLRIDAWLRVGPGETGVWPLQLSGTIEPFERVSVTVTAYDAAGTRIGDVRLHQLPPGPDGQPLTLGPLTHTSPHPDTAWLRFRLRALDLIASTVTLRYGEE